MSIQLSRCGRWMFFMFFICFQPLWKMQINFSRIQFQPPGLLLFLKDHGNHGNGSASFPATGFHQCAERWPCLPANAFHHRAERWRCRWSVSVWHSDTIVCVIHVQFFWANHLSLVFSCGLRAPTVRRMEVAHTSAKTLVLFCWKFPSSQSMQLNTIFWLLESWGQDVWSQWPVSKIWSGDARPHHTAVQTFFWEYAWLWSSQCEACVLDWWVYFFLCPICSGYCHQWSTARSGWEKVSARFPHISIGGFNQSVPCCVSSVFQYSSEILKTSWWIVFLFEVLRMVGKCRQLVGRQPSTNASLHPGG